MGVKGGLAKFLAKEGNKLSRTAKEAAGAAVEKGADLLEGTVKTAKSAVGDAIKATKKNPGKTAAAAGAAGALAGAGAAKATDDDKKKKKKRDWE